MSFPRPATEEAGGDSAPVAAAAQPFGPNSVEVSAFIDALGKLSGPQWRKVLAARRSAGSLIRDPTVLPAEAVRAMLRGEANGGIAPALAGILEPRSDEEVVTAWQAVSAVARRRQLSPLTFAAHYVPFAALIPPAADPLAPSVELFTRALRWLGESQWLVPDGDLLVMGDHRQDSADSRTFGPIEITHVIGRAWLRYWPFDTFGILPKPSYAAQIPSFSPAPSYREPPVEPSPSP